MIDDIRFVVAVIGLIAPAVLTPLLLELIRRRTPQCGKVRDGKTVLTYSNFWRGLLLSLSVIFLFGLQTSGTDRQTKIITLLGLAFLIPTAITIFCSRIEFDDTEIVSYSPWRSARRIEWGDILLVRHIPEGGYAIESGSQGRLRIDVGLTGVQSFLEEVARREIPIVEKAA